MMMWFKQRNELGKEVEKWMEENHAANTPLTTITYLVAKGWLKDQPIKCEKCIHFHPDSGGNLDYDYCHAWERITIPGGYCHKGKGESNDNNTFTG